MEGGKKEGQANKEEMNRKAGKKINTESICFIFSSLSSEKKTYLPCVSIQTADRTKHIL